MNYLDKLKHLNQPLVTDPTIQPGDRITWVRADGMTHTGLTDAVHMDEDGQHWAFCTLPNETWAAVNTKYVTKTEEGPAKA
jgi:plastocyanin